MGLSAGAIYVSEPNVGKDVATHLGLTKSDGFAYSEKGFDVGEGLRTGTTGAPWSVILGSSDALLPHMEKLSMALTELSDARRILFWYTQSVSGGVIFEIHENGALRRKWVEAEGQVFEELGDPVPEEEGLVDRENHEGGPLHSERTMLALAEKITGIKVDDHFEMDGLVYAAAP